MSSTEIFQQLSDFGADWEKPQPAVSRFICLDNELIRAHSSSRVAGSHLLANLSLLGPAFEAVSGLTKQKLSNQ